MGSRAEDLFDEIMANKDRIESWFQEKMADGWQEDEFLDFKASEIIDRQSAGKKFEKFRESLCEAFSAFGNTEGGVLLVGLVAKPLGGSRDVVQSFTPLTDCIEAHDHFRRIKNHLTAPAVNGIRCEPLKVGSENKGYLAFLVPLGEHRPYRAEHIGAYFQRNIDSSFVMNHEVLRTMFYPKSSPKFIGKCEVTRFGSDVNSEYRLDLQIKNIGAATAERVSLEVCIKPCSHIHFNRDFADGRYFLSNSIDPKPTPSYSQVFLFLSNDIHPKQTTDKLVFASFNSIIAQYTSNSSEGRLDDHNNVIMPNGILAEVTVFCRNNTSISLSGTIPWEVMRFGRSHEFELVESNTE